MKIFFVTTAAIFLSSSMAISAVLQELPLTSSSSSSSSSFSSNKNLNSDLITEYILRDLLKSSSIKNKQPQSQSISNLKPWFAQQAQQQQYQFQPEKNIEQQQQLELLQEDPSLVSLLSDSLTPNANQQMMDMSDDFYYPPQQPLSLQQQPATLVEDGQRILGWFQDPIIDPRISPIAEIMEDGDNLGDIDGGDDESMGDESNSNNLDDVLLNALWARYLSGFNNQNEDKNNNEELSNGSGYDPQLFKDYEYKLNQMIEKRRQKIVKHNNGQASKSEESTSTTTTTMRPILPTSATSVHNEKAKFLHKASNGAGNHLAKFGQKEYPMLRPASDRKNDEHDQIQNGNQWPSELDDNTLADVSNFSFILPKNISIFLKQNYPHSPYPFPFNLMRKGILFLDLYFSNIYIFMNEQFTILGQFISVGTFS